MDSLGMLAVVACLASLGAKWFFSLQLTGLKRSVEVERQACQNAKTERDVAVHQNKVLIAEQRQLEGQRDTIQRNIARNDKILDGLAEKEEEAEQTKVKQKELIDQAKKTEKSN